LRFAVAILVILSRRTQATQVTDVLLLLSLNSFRYWPFSVVSGLTVIPDRPSSPARFRSRGLLFHPGPRLI